MLYPCLLPSFHLRFISLVHRPSSFYLRQPTREHLADSPLQQTPSAPAPLQIPPSRARRQFALRLAQRKAALESIRDQEVDLEGDEEAQEREVKEGHERFAKMFEGIDDSSSDSDGDEAEGGSALSAAAANDEAEIVGKVDLDEDEPEPYRGVGDEGGAGTGKAKEEGVVVI